MADQRAILVCSCEDTMPLDAQALRLGCRGAHLVSGRQFCRAELERFRELAASGAPITMGCTQEASLFREIAAGTSDVTYRESARECRLVSRCFERRAEDGRARRRGGGTDAGRALRQPQKRRDHSGIRSRRARNRGGEPPQGSSRRHRPHHAAGPCGAAARHRFSDRQRHDPLRQGPSRHIRADCR